MPEAIGMVHRTEQARDLFFNQGLLPADVLAPHITRSWSRSRGAGVLRMEAAPLGEAQMRERRAAARLLLESAQPELDALAEHAIGHGCVVIVTDPSGVILDEIGSPEFLPKAQRVALLPGVDWSERQCGTNAIGTVLVERQALAVLGGEHFLAGHSGLGCAASPIFTGRGDIAGVLDISGDAVRIDGHTLGMVRMASQQIEHRMLLARARGDVLRFHANASLLGSAREGLLSVVDGQVVAANRIALNLLGQGWAAVLDQPVENVMGAEWGATGRDSRGLTLPGGQQIVVSRLKSHAVGRGWERPAADAAPEARPDPVASALQRAVKVLDAGVAVLVSGETGVGKEVFARQLHAASRRSRGPLVIVNCAALPETLIEAELFGYEEGAFTGARRQGTVGRIREAHGGSLMLDEIGDMPLALQTRLLRVLEDRTVTPLGSGRAQAVDFQLICATHRDLSVMAAEGSFRADLMYRLNGYEVRLPPLRLRPDRDALIQRLFLDLGGAGKQLRLGADAFDRLCRHAWPGNVRELVGVLRTTIALAEPGSRVDQAALPLGPAAVAAEPAAEAGRAAPPTELAELTQQAIEDALVAAGGQVALAARRLGVHRSTVYRHVRRRAG